MTRPVVLALTGASGAPYAVRLLELLARHAVPTWLIVSSHGWRLLAEECGIHTAPALKAATGGDWSSVTLFDDGDRGARPASGSARTAGMVICPCSMGTVAAIAHGTSRSLVERAADVTLKERRPLIVVPRETPLSLIHLRNLTQLTEAGGIVMPAAPGFYHRPTAIAELVDFVVQRVLDHLDVEIEVAPRWNRGRSEGRAVGRSNKGRSGGQAVGRSTKGRSGGRAVGRSTKGRSGGKAAGATSRKRP